MFDGLADLGEAAFDPLPPHQDDDNSGGTIFYPEPNPPIVRIPGPRRKPYQPHPRSKGGTVVLPISGLSDFVYPQPSPPIVNIPGACQPPLTMGSNGMCVYGGVVDPVFPVPTPVPEPPVYPTYQPYQPGGPGTAVQPGYVPTQPMSWFAPAVAAPASPSTSSSIVTWIENNWLLAGAIAVGGYYLFFRKGRR